MRLRYSISAKAPHLPARGEVPAGLAPRLVLAARVDDLDTLHFVFREPDFGQIPALREWLAGLPGPRVTEIGGREPDPGGTPAAPLAHLSNGELLGFSGAT